MIRFFFYLFLFLFTPINYSMDESARSDSIISTDSPLTTSSSSEESEEYYALMHTISEPIDIPTNQISNSVIITQKQKRLTPIIKKIRHISACFSITLDPQIELILHQLTETDDKNNKILTTEENQLIDKIETSTEQLTNYTQALYTHVDHLSSLVLKLYQNQQSTTHNKYDTLSAIYNVSWCD